MKIYRLHMNGDFGDTDSKAIWFINKAAAPRLKRQLVDACVDAESRPEPELEQFDVSSDKRGLVDFLNKHCSR